MTAAMPILTWRTHSEHCLDVIRQVLQCHGSTTLLPRKFRESLQRDYVDADQKHTCRSFSFLRDFTTSRRKGNKDYVPRDKALIDERKHEIALAWGKIYGHDAPES